MGVLYDSGTQSTLITHDRILSTAWIPNHDDQQNNPDVKQEGWSAEQIAEQAAYKDATEVKEEMKQGRQTQREDEKDA